MYVQQKGSLVNDEKPRFDFSHTTAVSQEELAAIEQLVNKEVVKNREVTIEKRSTTKFRIEEQHRAQPD